MTTEKPSPTGNDIREKRAALRFTQQELADYWSVSRVTVGQWERLGDQVLPHPNMMAILLADLENKAK